MASLVDTQACLRVWLVVASQALQEQKRAIAEATLGDAGEGAQRRRTAAARLSDGDLGRLFGAA